MKKNEWSTYPTISTNVIRILKELKTILKYGDLTENDEFVINLRKQSIYYKKLNKTYTFNDFGIQFKARLKKSFTYRLFVWTFFKTTKIVYFNTEEYWFKIKDLSIFNVYTFNIEWFKKNLEEFFNENNRFKPYFISLLFYLFCTQNHKNDFFWKYELLRVYNTTENEFYKKLESLKKSWGGFEKLLSINTRVFLIDKFKEKILYKISKILVILDSFKSTPLTNNSSYDPIVSYTNQKNILDIKKLEDLLMVKDTIFIPQFQREYVWKTWIITKLVEDIIKLLKNNKGIIFLGTLIFTRNNEKEGELVLVDGQQRYLTLLIILKVLSFFIIKANKKISKKWIEFLKSRYDRVQGMDYVKTLLKIISQDTTPLNKQDMISPQTRNALLIIYDIFKKKYKRKELFYDNLDYFSILGERIKIYGFSYEKVLNMRDSIEIFVTQNTSSQIIGTHSLIMALFMVKLDSKDVTFANLNIINYMMTKDEYFRRYLNQRNNIFLKNFYLYLCIKNEGKIEKTYTSKYDYNTPLNNYNFFKDFVFPKFRRKMDGKKVFSFKEIKDYINEMKDFARIYWGLKERWENDKLFPPYNEEWKDIYDLLICLRKATTFYPIIIYLLHYFRAPLNQNHNRTKLKLIKLRELLWSLVKIYIGIYAFGESLIMFIYNYKQSFSVKHLENPKSFWSSLLSIQKKQNSDFILKLHEKLNYCESNDLIRIIYIIMELYIRGCKDIGTCKEPNKIICSVIEKNHLRNDFLNSFRNNNKYELEHIIPRSKKKLKEEISISFIEIEKLFENYYDCIGNITLLHSFINAKLQDAIYKVKSIDFQEKFSKDLKLLINEDVIIKIKEKVFTIKGPFNMGHYKNIEAMPNLEILKSRNKEIKNFISYLISQ